MWALLCFLAAVHAIRPPQHDLAGTSHASPQRAPLVDDATFHAAAARRLSSKKRSRGGAAASGAAAEGAGATEGDAADQPVAAQERKRPSKGRQRAAAAEQDTGSPGDVVLAHPAGWHEDDEGHERGSLNEEPPEEEDPAQAIPPWFQQPGNAEAALVSEAAAAAKRVGEAEHGHGGKRHLARRPRRHGSMEEAWLAAHRQYVREAYEVDRKGAWDVVFYGDSIIEEWRCARQQALCSPQHHPRGRAHALVFIVHLAVTPSLPTVPVTVSLACMTLNSITLPSSLSLPAPLLMRSPCACLLAPMTTGNPSELGGS